MDLKTLSEKHTEYLACIDKINAYYKLIYAPLRAYSHLREMEDAAYNRYLCLKRELSKESQSEQQKVWESVEEKTEE